MNWYLVNNTEIFLFYHIITLVSQVNIAIRNFLVSNSCKIRFHDVIIILHCSYVYIMTSSYAKHGQMSKFWTFFFNSVCLIQLFDKKNLTFVDYWDKILSNSSWKTLFQDSFNKILSQSLTHDRSYISFLETGSRSGSSFCDELCQLYNVIYKIKCPTLFHTERQRSSFFL